MSRKFNTTDDRDRIWALRAVLIDIGLPFLIVDYTLDTEQTYEEFARTVLIGEKSLWLVLYGHIPR